MSATAGAASSEKAARSFRAYWALAALVAGLVLGLFADRWSAAARDGALSVASFIGTLWLNGLKMTVIPLVVTLLVTGIANSA